uniref:Uncharacterized protein n=1 Tax=Rhizophora mucronata TaxID=61149 RepID=A0A2P2PVR4_RHIMU
MMHHFSLHFPREELYDVTFSDFLVCKFVA